MADYTKTLPTLDERTDEESLAFGAAAHDH